MKRAAQAGNENGISLYNDEMDFLNNCNHETFIPKVKLSDGPFGLNDYLSREYVRIDTT